jgi:FkbM family methyltransferase
VSPRHLINYVGNHTPREMLVAVAFKLGWRRPPRLARAVERYRLARLPRYAATRTTLYGVEVEVVDPVSYLFMLDEIFDREIYAFETVEAEPYILDGGANIGLATIYFKRRFPRARVVAFEPDPALCGALRRNLGSFRLQDVEVIEGALHDADGFVEFFSEGSDGGRVDNVTEAGRVIGVKAVRLRSFLDRPVDLLKLDIEGAEVRVLKDVRDQLGCVRRLFVEYHSFAEAPQALAELFALLEKAGFRMTVTAPSSAGRSPFLPTAPWNGMDMQINIFGYR